MLSNNRFVEREISPRKCNDRHTNNYIDRNAPMLKMPEENRSMHPHPFIDNIYQHNQDTFLFNEAV